MALAQAGERLARRPVVQRGADEPLRGVGAGRGEDVVHVARLDDLPVLHHGDAVAGRAHDLHLVRDDDDGDAELGVDAPQEREDLARRLGVERGGRLVGEEDRGLRRERAGDPDALLLPARELARVGLRLVGEPHEREELGDARRALLARPARHLERVGHVPGDGARRQEVELLEHHPDPRAHLAHAALGQARDDLAVDDDLAARHRLQRVDEPHERRLPGAGVADDAEDLAAADGQRDVVDRVHGTVALAEGLAHVAQLDRGLLVTTRVAGTSVTSESSRRRPGRRAGPPGAVGRPPPGEPSACHRLSPARPRARAGASCAPALPSPGTCRVSRGCRPRCPRGSPGAPPASSP